MFETLRHAPRLCITLRRTVRRANEREKKGFYMKKIYAIAWTIFSGLSFCSCQSETVETRQTTQTKNNVIYLHQAITKAGEASAKFEEITRSGNVLVDFYASWCGPCKAMSPVIDQVAKQFPNVTFLKVDVDQFGSVASGIKSIPVLRLYKNGHQVYSKPGALSQRDLIALLNNYF